MKPMNMKVKDNKKAKPIDILENLFEILKTLFVANTDDLINFSVVNPERKSDTKMF